MGGDKERTVKNILVTLLAVVFMGLGCQVSNQSNTSQTENPLIETTDRDGYAPDETETICGYQNIMLYVGETYDDGCNTHTCQSDGTILSTEKACDESPSDDSASGTVTAGRFAGTEKACEFADNASRGDRIKCNVGLVVLSVVDDDGTSIWLDGYQCDAVEYLVKESDGYSVEYETTECTAGIVVGGQYTFFGTLQEREDQWYMGKQQNETWLIDAVVR